MRVGGKLHARSEPRCKAKRKPRAGERGRGGAGERGRGGAGGGSTVTPATNPVEPLLKYGVTSRIVYAL